MLSTCEDTEVFMTKSHREAASQLLSSSDYIVTLLFFRQANSNFINIYSQPSRNMRHSQMFLDILSQSLVGGNHRRLFLWGIQRIVRLKNVSRVEKRLQERNVCLCNLPQRSTAEITHQAQMFPLA